MLFQCGFCRCTVIRFVDEEYLWNTGAAHNYNRKTDMSAWLDAVAADALAGDEDAAALLPRVVESWLAA